MVAVIVSLAAGIVGGAFFILASPSYGIWWLGLAALVPVYYVRLVSRSRAAVLAPAAFALAFAFHNAKWYFTFMADAKALAVLGCVAFALLYFGGLEVAAAAGRRRRVIGRDTCADGGGDSSRCAADTPHSPLRSPAFRAAILSRICWIITSRWRRGASGR